MPDALTEITSVCKQAGLSLFRYSSKEALTEIHQQSAPFRKFKEQGIAANLEYTSKTGESYYEEDLGFM